MLIKMNRVLRKAGSEEAGFTLIELIVVIVIIGILAALVLPRIISAVTKDARDNADKANFNLLQAAADRYAADTNQTVPDGGESVLQVHLAAYSAPSGVSNWKGPYIREIPKKQDGTNFSIESGRIK